MAIGSLKLNPTFDANVTEYTATTSNASNKITAVPENDNANIVIKNNGNEIGNGESCSWSNGTNILTISVSNGSNSKTYTVNVTKS